MFTRKNGIHQNVKNFILMYKIVGKVLLQFTIILNLLPIPEHRTSNTSEKFYHITTVLIKWQLALPNTVLDTPPLLPSTGKRNKPLEWKGKKNLHKSKVFFSTFLCIWVISYLTNSAPQLRLLSFHIPACFLDKAVLLNCWLDYSGLVHLVGIVLKWELMTHHM